MSLQAFMHAIGTLESGNDYNAIGPQTGKYGKARGRYQIMETIWPGWAAEAGVPGANWRDPKAQDRVAAYKMSQYYDRYKRWDLVAIAWFAGPGRANEAEAKGIGAVADIADVTGTDVAKYVDEAMGLMGVSPVTTHAWDEGARTQPGTPVGMTPATAEREPILSPDQKFVKGARASSDTMASIMSFLSDRARMDGGRVFDTRALFGDLFVSGDDESEDEVA